MAVDSDRITRIPSEPGASGNCCWVLVFLSFLHVGLEVWVLFAGCCGGLYCCQAVSSLAVSVRLSAKKNGDLCLPVVWCRRSGWFVHDTLATTPLQLWGHFGVSCSVCLEPLVPSSEPTTLSS